MFHVLLLEPDRVAARCLRDELEGLNMRVSVAATAGEAVVMADEYSPDAVVSELSLPGHSGSEFLYEFRTYTDWQSVPLIIYSTMKLPARIATSKDWQLLDIKHLFYKPDDSLQDVGRALESIMELA